MSDDPAWKTIKIPIDAYNRVPELRERLINLGFGALPDHMRDALAPSGGGIGIGTVVTLALANLAWSLEEIEEQSSGSRKKRKR